MVNLYNILNNIYVYFYNFKKLFYIFDFVSLLLMFVNLPWFGGEDYFGRVIIEKRIYKDNWD